MIPALPFRAIEPASIKIMAGLVPVEIAEIYPALQTVSVQVSRSGAGAGTMVLSAARDEFGEWPVLDGGYFDRWTPIRIIADFGVYQEDVLWGHVMKITPEFPKERGQAKVTIEFQDQSILLDREQVTKVWGEADASAMLTDLSVAQTVLAAYGLRLSATSAIGQSFRSINQDKTDFRFLAGLAEAVGHEFRIMFGEGHFAPVTLSGEVQEPILVYAGADTNCLSFQIEEEAAVPDQAAAAAVDGAATAAPESRTYSPDLPVLGQRLAKSEASGAPPYVWRLRQEGDQSPSAAEKLAQAKINLASLSIKAECEIDSTLYGHVVLPGRLISVDGVGRRYGGRFYVDQVEHSFDATGYRQKLKLIKNGLDEG